MSHHFSLFRYKARVNSWIEPFHGLDKLTIKTQPPDSIDTVGMDTVAMERDRDGDCCVVMLLNGRNSGLHYLNAQ